MNVLGDILNGFRIYYPDHRPFDYVVIERRDCATRVQEDKENAGMWQNMLKNTKEGGRGSNQIARSSHPFE